jgi:hypothetical protein
MEAMGYSRNVGWLNGLDGVIFQKMVLFITTAVRTSSYKKNIPSVLLTVESVINYIIALIW